MATATESPTTTWETAEDLLERPRRDRTRPGSGSSPLPGHGHRGGPDRGQRSQDRRSASWSTASWWRRGWAIAESVLAGVVLGDPPERFVVPRNLGIVTGADGMMRLFPGLVRDARRRLHLLGPDPRSAASRPSRSPDSPPTWPSRS